jgi:hypothetical protein
MNKMQKRIVIAGALIVILMGLIPPWTYTYSHSTPNPAGYALIIAPPSPGARVEGASFRADGVELDFKRLLVQWVITGIATGIGFALAHTKSKKSTE